MPNENDLPGRKLTEGLRRVTTKFFSKPQKESVNPLKDHYKEKFKDDPELFKLYQIYKQEERSAMELVERLKSTAPEAADKVLAEWKNKDFEKFREQHDDRKHQNRPE